MKRILIALLIIHCSLLTAYGAQQERYVVIISLDGCRWDYPEMYDAPFLGSKTWKGTVAGLIPSFPSKTFPNHYTIATGLVPDHHGIIHNSFLDSDNGQKFSLSILETKLNPKYWHGEPIWLTAKRQGIKTAVFYWPGSDIPINGEYPDIYHIYDKQPRLTVKERFDGIYEQLSKPEKERPHLIMAYSEEPDHNGHLYGPQDIHVRQAFQQMDSLLGDLYGKLMRLPIASQIDFLVVSDHGMAYVAPERTVRPSELLKKSWYKDIEGNMPALIYANEGCADSIYDALKEQPHLRVWRKGHVPAEFSYGTNKYCGDIIVSPDLGWIFWDDKTTYGGMHGYDPSFNAMQAIFRATGPDFRDIHRKNFRNVDIYPLVCHLLGIKPSPNDGNLEEIKDILR